MNGKQLKNSILQWAIQGKLVPQDPNDEPASVLLERIRAEKDKLVKEKKIKKDKNESIIYRGDDNSHYEKFLATGEVKCIDDEIPFEIPESWCWVRLGEIAEIARGSSPRPIKEYLTNDINGVNWIKIGDTEIGGKYINKTQERIKQSGLSKSRFVHKGDFLLTNSMSFGRPYITNIEGCIHDGWLVISPMNDVYDRNFLYYLLSSQFASSQFCGKVSGAVVKNLNSEKVAGSVFLLPPLSEQRRIVHKIEELFPLVEKYSTAQDKLDRLNSNIHALLRKSILQEAIQGKFVPQIAEEGTAQELLEQIRQEKLQLAKEGKLKKKDITDSIIFKGADNKYYEQVGKSVKEITEEIAFDLPNRWYWCRLKDICSIFTGATFKKEEATTTRKGIRILRGGNISPFELKIKDDDIFLTEDKVKADILLKENDILTPAVTSLENIGKMARVDSDMSDTTVGGFVFIIRLHLINRWFSKYILYLLSSPFMIDFMKSITNKSGQAFYNIGKERLSMALLPVPPLTEQYRIVAQIEKLFEQLR